MGGGSAASSGGLAARPAADQGLRPRSIHEPTTHETLLTTPTLPGSAPAPLRVGLIGYSLGGAVFHAPLIAVIPGLRLVAIVTADPARRAQAERDHPSAAIVDSAEWLWANAHELDLVVIATPNRTHIPLALAAVAAGLHVVVDKPLAATAHDGRKLAEAAGRRGRLAVPYHNRRWDGDFRTVRALLRDGTIGRVMRFESRFERWRPVPRPGWRERPDPAEAGGILYDLGSHLIDQALALFGPARQVYAELERRRPGADVDDDAFVAIRHSSGVLSHLWMNAKAAAQGPRLRVLGTGGAYTKLGMDIQETGLREGRKPDEAGWGEDPEDRWGTLTDGATARALPTERGAYQEFYAELEQAIRTSGKPPVDIGDAIAGLEVIEAARQSAETAQVVRIRPGEE